MLLTAIGIVSFIVGQFRENPTDPKFFRSASGQYRLWVNPQDEYATTDAEYRLERSGVKVWERKLPFALQQAAVTDNGVVAGYAYGYRAPDREGTFTVAFLRPDGSPMKVDVYKRTPSQYLHRSDNPLAAGLMLDADHDRLIVRVSDPDVNRGHEKWWVYRLSTGVRLEDLDPSVGAVESDRYIVGAKPIPGTPLILVNRWRFDDQGMGAGFSLLDQDAKRVWELQLPGDYQIHGSEAAQDRLREEMQTRGAIESVSRNGFELLRLKEGRRVSYSITRSGIGGWIVKETGRRPLVTLAAKRTKRNPPIPVRRLQAVGKVVLPLITQRKSPVESISEFLISENGNIIALRESEKPGLVVVDPAGHLIREIKLPKSHDWKSPQWCLAHVGGARFLVVNSNQGQNGSALGYIANIDSGAVRRLTTFNDDDVAAVFGREDGSFVTKSTEHSRYSQTDHVTYYDPEGRRLWRRGENGFGGAKEELLSAEDVTIDPAGAIVVLDNIRHTLQFFGPDSKFRSIIDLKKVWGREPEYPTNLTRDKPDGFVLNDSGTIYRLAPNGQIRRRIQPTLTGKNIQTYTDAEVDSHGSIWITNGHAIFRLNDRGEVVQTLGNFSTAGGLRSIDKLLVDPSGKSFAIDSLSGEVHSFDERGRRRFVAYPNKEDFEGLPINGARVLTTRSGDIYVDFFSGPGTIHFSSAGKRIGVVTNDLSLGGPPPPSVLPTWRWSQSRLLDENGHTVTMIRRWPNLDWVDANAIVAPDGTVAVYEPHLSYRSQHPGRAGFYSSTGMPLGQVTVPYVPGTRSPIYTGKLLLFARQNDVVAVDKTGKPVWRIPLPASEIGWGLFATNDGFAAYDYKATIYRFAIKK